MYWVSSVYNRWSIKNALMCELNVEGEQKGPKNTTLERASFE